MGEFVAVEEHLERVLAAVPRLPRLDTDLHNALGLILAEPIGAKLPIPPWTNSAMDGYAVRAVDVAGADTEPVTLRVVADVPAGSGLDPHLGPGEAARIMTGAALPSAADAVVQLELTNRTDTLAALPDTVTVLREVAAGTHVRRAGEDCRIGDRLVPAGTVVTAEVASAAASAGHGSLLVSQPPTVAVITTGDELAEPGEALERGMIPNSNALLVRGLALRAGARVPSVRSVDDSARSLSGAIDAETGVDVLILTGGVSAGAFDPVKALFTGSDRVTFTRVGMQPGKPQAFGILKDGRVLLALPGNPVSAWVSFHVFVRPALMAMQGVSSPVPAAVPARAAASWRTPPGRRQYLPARVAHDGEGHLTVAPVAALGSGSHLVGSLAAANGYAIVPAAPQSRTVEAGQSVEVVLTDTLLSAKESPWG